MSLQETFQVAAKDCPRLKIDKASIKLKFYGLYKQAVGADFSKATRGPIFTESRAKYDAWEKVLNVSAEDAQKQYIEYFEELKAKYGLKPEEPKPEDKNEEKKEDKDEDWVNEN